MALEDHFGLSLEAARSHQRIGAGHCGGVFETAGTNKRQASFQVFPGGGLHGHSWMLVKRSQQLTALEPGASAVYSPPTGH